MATVDGITVAKAIEIEQLEIVSAAVVSGQLILTKANGTTVNAGSIADTVHQADVSTHGISSFILGSTEVQTMSNKTLLLPIITDFTNAQHDHGDADDGGPLAIGRADSPAPVTFLNQFNLSDGDPARTMASLSLAPGRWLILATSEGITLPGNGTFGRWTFDLSASQPTLVGKPVTSESDRALLNGGATIWGWLENTSTSVVSFRITKNGSGALITNSTNGALIAIRMG